MEDTRFNLLDEAWIPVADAGMVSLRAVFQRDDLRALGGTALHKIALLKLFVAVAQAAHTPKDDVAWAQMGKQGMSDNVLTYLEHWREHFWLYGRQPFLQMPAVKKAKLQEYGVIMPEVATGNATVLTQWQHGHVLSDAERVLLLLVNMSLCFSGKKTDKMCVLTPGTIKGSAKSGPALCHLGLLHTFLTGESLRETVWLNVQSLETIHKNKVLSEGVGTPPWETMPQGEACAVAERFKHSLMGRLVPLARFCLLQEHGVHYAEGLQHPDYQQGFVDPSASVREAGKKTSMLWCDPSKRPWRSLTSLLSFLKDQTASDSFTCALLQHGVPRLKDGGVTQFGIWSGGIRVSSNAGEQYLTGSDDLVESEILLNVGLINDETWFSHLQADMLNLEAMAKILYGAVMGYFNELKDGNADRHAVEATHRFWQLAEHRFQTLIDACATEDNGEARKRVMQHMAQEIHMAYHVTCPQDMARQLQSWVRHRPRLGKILHGYSV